MHIYQVFLIYIGFINLVGVFLMWRDKRYAIKDKWRTPEKTLFSVALLGGVIGIYLGMKRFRHKTKKWYFVYGIPVIFFVYLALLSCFFLLRK